MNRYANALNSPTPINATKFAVILMLMASTGRYGLSLDQDFSQTPITSFQPMSSYRHWPSSTGIPIFTRTTRRLLMLSP